MRRIVYTALTLTCVALAPCAAAGAGGAQTVGNTPGPEKVYVTCPAHVRVGVRDLPDGWNPVSVATPDFVEASVLGKPGAQVLVCLYADQAAGEHSIMRPVPAGLDCRPAQSPKQQFVCTPKPKAPVKLK